MTSIALVFVVVILFFIGLVSPYTAGKIQRETDKEAGWLKRCANWFWDPITWWAKNSIDFTRKVIKKAAGWGKKSRKKM